ncbi:glucans biosynthesis protein [Rhodovulum sulfidophilum]|uniref:glucan biosynthesis protein n=1 Tax=Rhodovulum sulfidophilum TaxID=35806 RepID=UPI0005A5FF65|nr:glucan biosynthesis protein D [Rhodovulum sulfidophilum]ANB32978.1 glucan biosynthesis protein D [Rhodovulum sulfidophilum DSM 1374]ANB36827.1 glucan biosynthesis protein D [Rhodovulum sulfidophilum]MCW2304683.1 glucans biosynthesis protein [Rhodovulum sulfidophilum]
MPTVRPTAHRFLTSILFAAATSFAAAPFALADQVSAPAIAGPELGAPTAFSFDMLADRAAALAARPHVPTPVHQPDVLEKIDYDAHWKIRFRRDATLMLGNTPAQFFHLGTYFREPVKIFAVESGTAREVVYSTDYFDMPEDSPAHALKSDAGFAGFRLMRPDMKTDWISFLGAAYFRSDGALRQYGLSARGIALNTGMSVPEEFPRFSEFYLEPGPDGRTIVNALLDGPSVTGAYRMVLGDQPGQGQVMDITARLFFRAPVERLGIAPLTSMFWYSESNRFQSADWRPEVHDTDGLMIETGAGEHIWRPLNNPDRVVTSSYFDRDIRGFGLIQRDREFENYQDDGVFYDKRPAVWVEPTSPWGAGAVQLIEIPTDDEIFDNIVAFWNPETKPQAGDEMAFSYRLHWTESPPVEMKLARTVATRIGNGGVPGQPRPEDQIKVVVDFEGPALDGLTRKDAILPQVSAPEGVEIVTPFVLPVVGTDRWRMVFDLKAPPGTETVDLRAFLTRNGRPLTETWLGQIHPDQIERLR